MSPSLPPIQGIHHVTAIASDPNANAAFYAGVLGLRLVKRTVNFDDPAAYHLYYGDAAGNPGSLLTFFLWPGAPRGQRGVGQLTATSFLVPARALGYWTERLKSRGIPIEGPASRLDEEVISLRDPDGLPLEIVAWDEAQAEPGIQGGPVPLEHSIRRFAGVTLAEAALEGTASLLEDAFGFRRASQPGNRVRFQAGPAGRAAGIDVLLEPSTPAGHVAVGTVHHVAWRAPDATAQEAWRRELLDAGYQVTPVVDRLYFRSIYFRERGGALFEIATDGPGFAVDEPVERLGEQLVLPPWLEPSRERIARSLPPLEPPALARG